MRIVYKYSDSIWRATIKGNSCTSSSCHDTNFLHSYHVYNPNKVLGFRVLKLRKV